MCAKREAEPSAVPEREREREREKAREADGSDRERERERERECALRTKERVVFRVVYHARERAIVLLREVDRSLSLSHAALIAHRSLIYRAGEERSERAIRGRIEYNVARFILPARIIIFQARARYGL